MNCELCGKVATLKAVVESVTMDVCASCGRFGTVLKTPIASVIPAKARSIAASSQPVIVQGIVTDAGERIKQARERAGLSQKDFALKINEHQSVLHHAEAGHAELSIELARKLERALHVVLIEDHQEVKISATKSASEPVTLGDLIKIKGARTT